MGKRELNRVLFIGDCCDWEVVGVETETDGTVNKMLIQYTCIGLTAVRDVEYIEKGTVICPFCGRYVQFLTLNEHLKKINTMRKYFKTLDKQNNGDYYGEKD